MPSLSMAYEVHITDAPDPKDRDALAQPLLAYNEALLGSSKIHPVAVLVRSLDHARVIGGLWGRTSFQWLFVEFLFLPEALRGQKLGTRLLAEAEREARARGCLGSWLETFSADACRFYERRGYLLFGAIADYPPGHARSFLSKRFDTEVRSIPVGDT